MHEFENYSVLFGKKDEHQFYLGIKDNLFWFWVYKDSGAIVTSPSYSNSKWNIIDIWNGGKELMQPIWLQLLDELEK